MRPGQIRVFDGLRVTTEHVDHFQASVHSAIEDLREILGLGTVQAGFEVRATGPSTLTVEPGIAFDLRKNRIVSDEPQSLEVSFEAGRDTAFVCAQYDQIASGETEGRSTLLWDGCTLTLEPTLPADEDNRVVLARVDRNPDGTLEVTHPAARAAEAAVLEDASPDPAAPAWKIEQGVLRLTSGSAEGYPGSSIADRVRSASDRIFGSGHDLGVRLSATALPTTFLPSSLSCHVVTSVSVELTGEDPISTRFVSSAEATLSAEGLVQFGVSPLDSSAADVIEGALLRAPLVPPPALHDALGPLALVVRAERSGPGIDIVCNLVWTDITTNELLVQLDALGARLTWSHQVAWKATGQV